MIEPILTIIMFVTIYALVDAVNTALINCFRKWRLSSANSTSGIRRKPAMK
jgi:hypothetical protein